MLLSANYANVEIMQICNMLRMTVTVDADVNIVRDFVKFGVKLSKMASFNYEKHWTPQSIFIIYVEEEAQVAAKSQSFLVGRGWNFAEICTINIQKKIVSVRSFEVLKTYWKDIGKTYNKYSI